MEFTAEYDVAQETAHEQKFRGLLGLLANAAEGQLARYNITLDGEVDDQEKEQIKEQAIKAVRSYARKAGFTPYVKGVVVVGSVVTLLVVKRQRAARAKKERGDAA